jgi:hypothetical protein
MIDVRSHEEYDGTDELTKYGNIHDSRSIPILEFEPALE